MGSRYSCELGNVPWKMSMKFESPAVLDMKFSSRKAKGKAGKGIHLSFAYKGVFGEDKC